MSSQKNKNLFQKLTSLFKSGPVVRRKIRTADTTMAMADKTKSSGTLLFQKSMSPTYATITANAYNLSERLMRYQDFSEMEYCLSGDTLIPCVDGTLKSLEELAKECEQNTDHRFIVYAYDHNDGKIIPTYGKQARHTRTDHAWKVTFDNGKTITGSGNHRLMMADGTYKEIQELNKNDCLMPFHRAVMYDDSSDYENIKGLPWVYTVKSETIRFFAKNPKAKKRTAGWAPESLLIAELLTGEKFSNTKDVGHINGNKLDNRPENLIINGKALTTGEITKSQKLRTDKQTASERELPITFGQLLQVAEEHDFDMHAVEKSLGLNQAIIRTILHRHGFETYKTFTDAYKSKIIGARALPAGSVRTAEDVTPDLFYSVLTESDTQFTVRKKLGISKGDFEYFLGHKLRKTWAQIREQNGWLPTVAIITRQSSDESLSIEDVIAKYAPNKSENQIAKELNVGMREISLCVSRYGWGSYKAFAKSRRGCVKVKSVEYVGVIPLYDMTVDGYKNFATDVVISHNTPEIASALDIFSDETCAQDDKGRILHVYSENEKIKDILEDLYYNILNVEFNLRGWTRNLCKYGDMLLYNDVSPEYGVTNVFPIPVNEIEREENYDKDDPFAVRYRWVTLGNRTLENWEVTHFRLLGNDMFLPYGSSLIEPARRIWRQLILIEDAMLVYRVVRAPERRVFYVDVASLPPENVPGYIEEQKRNIRSSQVVDHTSGRIDLRYNPMCIGMLTMIKLQDGRCLSLQDLIKERESGKLDQWVYSIDIDKQRVSPGKIVWAGKTRENADLVRVHIDNGSYFDCTPDHRFMLRNGEYKQAKDLCEGEALMPLYTKDSSKEDGHKIVGYECVYNPFTQQYEFTHRTNVIAEQGFDSIKGKVVHHKDFNKRNNNPENLTPMTVKEHTTYHASACAEYNRSEIGRSNSSKRMKRTWESGKISKQTAIDLWKNPEIAKKRIDSLTLNVGDKFVDHLYRIMDNLGTGLSTKQEQLLNAINTDEQFTQYLRDINPDFKNGFVDKFTRSSLQSRLKSAGFKKSIESLKRAWLKERYKIEDVIAFCESTPFCNRKQVLEHFSLQRTSFEELVKLHGYSYADFAKKFLPGNCKYKNHKVIRIEFLSHKEDTGCITVENYHNFAICSDIDGHDGLFVHNSVDEDYWLPVRGNETGTRIDTLAGGQNTASVEDVAYIQKKLFSALKVPKAYLGYDEALSSKATLAQIDIRFSRTINVIQKTLIAELSKLGIIHLYAHGFDGEDLQNFTLRMSNPSSVAQQQKLELWRAKFEIGGSLPEGMGSREFVQREVWGLTQEQIDAINQQRLDEKLLDTEIEAAGATDEGGGGEDLFAGTEEEPAEKEEETPPEENAGEEPEEEVDPSVELLTSSDNADDEEDFALRVGAKENEHPVKPKANAQLDRALYNKSRHRTHGASKTHLPDFKKMTGVDNESMKDPTGSNWIKSVVSNPFGESKQQQIKSVLSPDMKSTLSRMSSALKLKRNINGGLISETKEEVDIQLEIDDMNRLDEV